MNLKTATLLGMIGAIIPAILNIYYLMANTGVIEWSEGMSACTNVLHMISNCALALFFYILYTKQK